MSTSGEPLVGQAAGPDEDPRQAVARARAHVLGGRGPGARPTETDRYKRERPTLGPLPAPLERELVHLQTAGFRTHGPEVDTSGLDIQRRRLREVWGGAARANPGGADREAGRKGARAPTAATPSRSRLLWLGVAAVLGYRRR